MNNNLDLMRVRLEYQGGKAQQDRMIKDKVKTLDKAILYSYQGAKIKKIGTNENCPALINPNKVKQDYDDKIVSVRYEYNFAPGDIFEWENTHTKWLIYLQDATELAYFKGDIRKCNYEIKWLHDGVEKSTFAAIRGPVETKINFLQKNGISLETPNHSLNILMPKNKDTLEQFQRYSKFYLQGLPEGDVPVCWRVEATDSISMQGVLQITAVEYYANEFNDNVSEGLVDANIKPIIPEHETAEITGEIFIKPKKVYEYEYIGSENEQWIYNKELPIKAIVNGKKISLKWDKTFGGRFDLQYGTAIKSIIIDSLF